MKGKFGMSNDIPQQPLRIVAFNVMPFAYRVVSMWAQGLVGHRATRGRGAGGQHRRGQGVVVWVQGVVARELLLPPKLEVQGLWPNGTVPTRATTHDPSCCASTWDILNPGVADMSLVYRCHLHLNVNIAWPSVCQTDPLSTS